jgi:hypothetical protein
MTNVFTAKKLLEMQAPSFEKDHPKSVASDLNADVMNDIMTVVGVKLTRKEIYEIEERINERFLSVMISFLKNIGDASGVDMSNPIQHLSEVRSEIKNTH